MNTFVVRAPLKNKKKNLNETTNHLFDGFIIPLGTNHYLKPVSLLVAHWYHHKMSGLHIGLTTCFLVVP
jgi:hypothetical protein